MIASYKDLEVYQEGYRLAAEMYQLANKFPPEAYEIARQLKRAILSIPLNIAEGYGKRESTLEFKRFVRMAAGSVNEIEVLIEMLKDLGFIDAQVYGKYINEYQVLGKRLHKLLKNWQ